MIPAALIGSALPSDQQSNGHGWLAKLVPLVVAVIFTGMAVMAWRSVPSKGAETKEPKWMTAIEQMTPGKAAVLGFLMGFTNTKGALLDIHAGFIVGGEPLATQVVGIAVYTLIGISTVAVPVVAYLIFGHRLDGVLESVREWLSKHSTACIAVLCTMLAAQSFGKVLMLL